MRPSLGLQSHPGSSPSLREEVTEERRPDPLMAEANAERRGRRAQLLEDVSAHTEVPRVCRMAWPGGEDNRIGRKLPHVLHRNPVVAIDERIRAKFPNLLVQVVHE